MQLTYNELKNPENKLFFNKIPQIVRVSESPTEQPALLKLRLAIVEHGITEGQYYLTINGIKFTNTVNYKEVGDLQFYMKSDDVDSTLYNIASALRNSPEIASDYNAYVTNSDGVKYLYLEAKKGGPKFNIVFDTNLDARTYNTAGTSSSVLNNAKVSIDVYSEGKYSTTVEKQSLGKGTSFDVSKLLDAEQGKAKQFALDVYGSADGGYLEVGKIENNYVTLGYKANDSDNYLDIDETLVYLMNVKNGKASSYFNKSKLYLFPKQDISFSYTTLSNGGFSFEKRYTTKTGETLKTEMFSTPSSDIITDVKMPVDASVLLDSDYLEVASDYGTLIFNVVQSYNANQKVKRVLFRNEYGGLSFADFNEYEKTTDLEVVTVNESDYDYYYKTLKGMTKPFEAKYRDRITFRSPLVDEDGLYLFESLFRSPFIYTEEGERLIPISKEVSEQDERNTFIVELEFEIG